MKFLLNAALAVLLTASCATAQEEKQEPKAAEAIAAQQQEQDETSSPTIVSSGAAAAQSSDAGEEADPGKLKNKKTPLLGSSTYPLPEPVAITVFVSPGAEEDGITIVTVSRGFQMRTVFRSREASGVKISLEIFGEFSYFNDDPRITCKGMYSVQRFNKPGETHEFEIPYTFLKGSQPLILHAKDGKSISVAVSKKMPVP